MGVQTGEPTEVDMIFDSLWQQLGIDYYEQRAEFSTLKWRKGELSASRKGREGTSFHEAAGSLLLSGTVKK
jgi:hypothetical protein